MLCLTVLAIFAGKIMPFVTQDKIKPLLARMKQAGRVMATCISQKPILTATVLGAYLLIATSISPQVRKDILNSFIHEPPKNLILYQHKNVELSTSERFALSISSPGSKLVSETQDGSLDAIACEIKKHVAENGTLDKVMIVAHGQSMHITTKTGPVSISTLFRVLERAKNETGKPFAKTIQFVSCNTASNLSEEDVLEISGAAKKLGSTIMLSASVATTIGLDGDYYFFHPNGIITDDSGKNKSLMYETILLAKNLFKPEDPWIKFYKGTTVEDGARQHAAFTHSQIDAQLDRRLDDVLKGKSVTTGGRIWKRVCSVFTRT